MTENTQRPEQEHDAEESAYWTGYYRGIKEASETWTTIVVEAIEPGAEDIIDNILALATQEIGKSGIERTAKP